MSANCLDAPLTKNIILEEAESTLGVREILLSPLPSLKITKSSALLSFWYGNNEAVWPSSPRPNKVKSKEGG